MPEWVARRPAARRVTTGHRWAILLAAGEGSRIRHFAADSDGRFLPKQFWPIDGGTTMLDWCLERARRVVPRARIVTVVAEQHRPWWERGLRGFLPQNVVVQPQNRGTAIGVLLPLLEVLRRDPEAAVLLLPTDHFVERERVLHTAIRFAMGVAELDDRKTVLLGMEPTQADREYGWIVPRPPGGRGILRGVAAFAEKPDVERAAALRRSGGLINSFIVAARASRLLELCRRVMPEVVDSLLRAGRRPEAISALYEVLPTRDFSREVLEGCASDLSVVRVARCGWIDLGTPARLTMFREQRKGDVSRTPASGTGTHQLARP